MTKEERSFLIDQLIMMVKLGMGPTGPYNGVLGPVRRVFKVPEPARVTEPTPLPLKQPEEAPKEPVKAA